LGFPGSFIRFELHMLNGLLDKVFPGRKVAPVGLESSDDPSCIPSTFHSLDFRERLEITLNRSKDRALGRVGGTVVSMCKGAFWTQLASIYASTTSVLGGDEDGDRDDFVVSSTPNSFLNLCV
jgi:hypothetical protein